MRILALTNCPLDAALGSGKTVLRWSAGLRALGHEVEVCGPERFVAEGRRARQLRMAIGAWRFGRGLDPARHDLIEVYGGEFGLLLRQWRRRRPRPMFVAHTNGLELASRPSGSTRAERIGIGRRLLGAMLRHIHRATFRCADRFMAICPSDVDHLVRNAIRPADTCAVVEPGVDDEFLAAPWDGPREHRLAYVGNWIERKDPATVAAVVSGLLRDDPELCFDVLGTWGATETVHRDFEAALRPRVAVHRRLEPAEMSRILSRAKVFLLPSLYEGFGMATAEAMACGCAAVVTPTGFGATLRHGEEAMVCPFRDADAMKAAARALLGHESRRRRMAEAGRRRVERLTWDAQVRRLAAIYSQWYEQWRAGGRGTARSEG